MKFYKQWEVPVREIPVKTPSVSLTIPNQSLSIRKMVDKLRSGNMFGITQIPVEYDSQIVGENFQDVILPDHADPLTHSFDLQQQLHDFQKKYQEEKEKKSKSEADKKQKELEAEIEARLKAKLTNPD